VITPNPLIPAGSNALIIRLLGRMRDDTCVIQRKPTGVDAGGAPVSGAYTAVASVDCRVVASGNVPTENISGGRVGPVADYEIYLPPDTEIRSDDRIAVNDKVMEVVEDQDAVSHGYQLKVLVKAST
jgi:hypothetical protein